MSRRSGRVRIDLAGYRSRRQQRNPLQRAWCLRPGDETALAACCLYGLPEP